MFDAILDWVSAHPSVIGATVVLSILTFVGTLVLVPVLLVRMRADYFIARDATGAFRNRHPAIRIVAVAGKNLLGLALLMMGLIMLFVPGQGILTILIGVSLLDFPGKREFELRIASQRQVRRSIDWIRRRKGKEPLRFSEDSADART